MKFAIAWVVAAFVFVGLDAIWLSQVSPRLYPALIGELLSHRVEPVPAIAFYLIYITGIVLLAVLPAERGGLRQAFVRGATLGFVAYATYDLTNQATLRVWSTTITLADLAWGTVVTAIAAACAFAAASRVGAKRAS